MNLMLAVWAGIILGLFSVGKVYGAAPSITAYPSSVDLDSSFTLTATMSGLTSNAIYRLRIVFAQTGTSNYFGSTWNGSSWYSGTPSPINYANFYAITTNSNGAWWGDVQGKIEADDPNFTTGGGTYDVKLGRYTQTGSTATWSNIVAVGLSVPPTTTPTNTPTSTATPKPTSTPVVNTPLPTKTPTLTPSPSPSKNPSNTPLASTSASVTGDAESTTAVLGTTNATTLSPTTKPSVLIKAVTDNLMPTIMMGIGIVFMAGFAILSYPSIRFWEKNNE